MNGFYAMPGLVLAAGSGNPQELLWRVINLAVFLLILIYILRKKVGIGQIFAGRAQSITRDLEQARREKEEADRRLAEVEARLARLDQEVAQIRAEAQREAEREAERIRQAAEADAEKIRQLARREIEGASRAAQNELRAFVAEQSVELAEGIIRREIRPEDNARLVKEYIEELNEVSR